MASTLLALGRTRTLRPPGIRTEHIRTNTDISLGNCSAPYGVCTGYLCEVCRADRADRPEAGNRRHVSDADLSHLPVTLPFSSETCCSPMSQYSIPIPHTHTTHTVAPLRPCSLAGRCNFGERGRATESCSNRAQKVPGQHAVRGSSRLETVFDQHPARPS